ncbi:S8 family serine peptidase [Amycolatopsis sp. NPDC059090]|uniref:cyanobactin maturation protease PatG family protein n=1 Tax=unclassified Amycolatopsis TaxID=2618356 RepID=UPI0036732AAB
MAEIAAIPGVRELWDQTLGDPDVTIGLVEGPPALSHPCFAGADLTVLEPHWLPLVPVVDGLPQHATFVASVLFGQPGSPVHGLAPLCRGLVVPALRDEPTLLDPVSAVRAIETLVEAGADIVHFAASLPTGSGDPDPLLARAVRQAHDAGVLVVSPAGNDYGGNYVAPAVLPEVLAVGAHDDNGAMFRFSNWGERYRDHGLVAPGGDLAAAEPGGGTAAHKGTSVAAPIVTGVCALLASLRRHHGLPADPLSVRDALLAAARPCDPADSHGEPARCLAGKLDVPRATRLALAQRTRTDVVLSARRPDPVYVVGVVGYDCGTDGYRDSLTRQMVPSTSHENANPFDAPRMAAHLAAHPADAANLIWVLHQDHAPVYAIEPTGPYAAEVYRQLAELLAGQATASDAFADLVAVPGTHAGRTVRLLSGQQVPVLEAEQVRGVLGRNADQLTAVPADTRVLRKLLERVCQNLRNPGSAPHERALNFAATVHTGRIFAAAAADRLALEEIAVRSSPFPRPGSDAWEVKLRFFDPENTRRARRAFRVTVDVSDVLPVRLGEVREWAEP